MRRDRVGGPRASSVLASRAVIYVGLTAAFAIGLASLIFGLVVTNTAPRYVETINSIQPTALGPHNFLVTGGANVLIEPNVNGIVVGTTPNAEFTNLTLVGDMTCAQPLSASCVAAFPTGGDIQGPINNAEVVGLRNVPLLANAPANWQFLGYDGSGWTPIALDSQPGSNILISHASPTLVSTTQAVSITTLAVSQSTLLGTSTSCVTPLLPSCYDISNQGCPGGSLQASCLPSNAMFDNLLVHNLTLFNATTLNVPIGNQTVIYTDQLFVAEVEHLLGTLMCPAGSGGVDNACLSLGGYSCPVGVPLAESCIPASLVQYNQTVTNVLTVNQVQCEGPPLPSACLPAAGGDLIGSLSLATVAALRGVAISTTGPSNGQALIYNSGTNKWTPTTISLAGDVTGTNGATSVVALRGIALSGALPSNGQTLVYNSSSGQWTPAYDISGVVLTMPSSIFTVNSATVGTSETITVGYQPQAAGNIMAWDAGSSQWVGKQLLAGTGLNVVSTTSNVTISTSSEVSGTYGSLSAVPTLSIVDGLVTAASTLPATSAATASTYATRDANAASAFGSLTLGGTTQQALQFVAGTTAAEGIAFGSDVSPTTNLYRTAAGTLRTDGVFHAKPTLNGAVATIGGLAMRFVSLPTWNTSANSDVVGGYISTNMNNSLLGTNAISTAVVNAAGTNYTVGDLLVVSGGNTNSQLQVTSVAPITGAIISVLIMRGGSGYSAANGVTVTGGTGTGATVNITVSSASFSSATGLITGAIAANSGYSTAAVSSINGLVINQPDLGSGPMSVFSLYGLSVADHTVASQQTFALRVGLVQGAAVFNIGIQMFTIGTPTVTATANVAINCPVVQGAVTNTGIAIPRPIGGTTNRALWLSDTNNIADGGITWGADAQPTANLYRSAIGTLRTDAMFQGKAFRLASTSTTAITGSVQWNQTTGTVATGVGVLGTNSLNGLQLSTNGVATFAINNGGGGYVVNDLLTVTGGSGTAQVKVTSVSSGAILTMVLTRPGSGYSMTSGVALTGGSGANATLNILTINSTPFTTVVGVQGQGFDATGGFVTPTVTTAISFQTVAPNLGSGPATVTTIIGLDVPTHSIATTNAYGLRIAAPTGGATLNQAINLVDATGSANGGITWGTDAQPTVNLYRSAPNILRTDGMFQGKTFRTTAPSTTAITGSVQWNQTTGSVPTGVGVLGTNSLVGPQLSTNGVATFAINNGGSGYALNDLLIVSGGSGTAQVKVTSLSAGVILTVVLTRPGSGYSVTSNVALTGGTGANATLNILTINTTPFTTVVGVQGQGFDATGGFVTPTVTTAAAFQTLAPVLGSGPVVVTNIVGLDVPTHAIATTNSYGIRVAAPTGGTAINNALNFVSSTTASGGITFGADATPSTNLYRSATNIITSDADLSARHHYTASAGIPTVVAGTGAGTSPTITVAAGSTDCKMQIAVTTGTSPTAAGNIMVVTYNSAFINTLNKGVVFSAAGANAAALSGTTAPYISAEALGSFTFTAGSAALTGATTYTWNFQACT